MMTINFLLLDASDANDPRTQKEEGRSAGENSFCSALFHDLFWEPSSNDTNLRSVGTQIGFKVRRQVIETAGWMQFLVGPDDEHLQEAALLVAGKNDADRQWMLEILNDRFALPELPESPLAVIAMTQLAGPLVDTLRHALDGFFR